MPIVLILLGAVLLVAAYNNTQGQIASELATDLPGFAKWFLSVALVGGLGYIPGMRTISRWLLGLVLLVLVVHNYKNVMTGFKNAASGASTSSTAQTSPAAAVAANPSNPSVTTAEVTGTTSGSGTTTASTATASTTTTSPYDPAAYVAAFAQTTGAPFQIDLASMGFGGVA
jgi:flagellar biosynthesis component FlhA